MRTAFSMVSVRALGSSITILPNPMYTGGGPASRKALKSGEGLYEGGSRKKKPQTSLKGQSLQHSCRGWTHTYMFWPVCWPWYQCRRPTIRMRYFQRLQQQRTFRARHRLEIKRLPPFIDKISNAARISGDAASASKTLLTLAMSSTQPLRKTSSLLFADLCQKSTSDSPMDARKPLYSSMA